MGSRTGRNLLVVVSILLMGGCAPVAVEPVLTEVPAPPIATGVPPTATSAPTDTPLPPTSTPEDDGVWDYVALGDSIPGGGGVPIGTSYVHLFADYVREDRGVEVRLHNRSAGAETTVTLLGRLQTDEIVRGLVAEAELITIWIGSNDIWRLAYGPGMGAEPPECGPIGDHDTECLDAEVQALVGRIDAILAEVVALREGQGTLIYIAEDCNWFVEDWQDRGAFDQMKEPAFDAWVEPIAGLAAEHGAIVVPTYAACNGPDGREPIPPEYLQPTDAYHFSETGHQMIADLHREVGYELGP